jgi:chromosome partitioning protein
LPTVAFVSPKGGAGKTTAALLLALGLGERGRRVAMIDADPNKPLVHWASLPGRPNLVSVHAAPTETDYPDALREARARRPDWIVVDTEGSPRQGVAFAQAQPDLVVTPLASSALEALQALKAAEMVREASRKLRRKIAHVCLLTRLPAALRPRSLKQVIEQLRAANILILPTAVIEKEAFRTLFAVGGGLADLERGGLHGVAAARVNAGNYVDAIMGLLEPLPDPAPAGGGPALASQIAEV